MAELRIARDLALPLDVVTQAIAILARRGAGKTYTAAVLVEEVIGAGAPVVVLDPTGAWWGLRTSADGKKAGLPVVILGGEHGDVALERTAGKEIADVVIDHPGAYVIDLSGFESNQAQDDFAADFLERLYRAKAKRRDALLLVVDEADSFAPQRPGPRQLRMLGALEAIVRRGRIRGLGVVLISQRAAVLNKNVLTQCEVLVALQTTGPQDRAAIDDWIKGNGTPDEREAVMGSLASLERGEAWVWSPAWLRILQRVRIRTRRTFDSSATPEAGAIAIAPTARAAVDLVALGERIAATVERAKANDPAELRKRIRELETAAATPAAPETVVETVETIVEVPVLNGEVGELRAAIGELVGAGQRLVEVATAVGDAAAVIQATGSAIAVAIERVSAPRSAPVIPAVRQESTGREPDLGRTAAPRPQADPRPREESAPMQDGAGSSTIGKAERQILGALAAYTIPLSREQLAFLSDYHPRSSGFVNALGALRTAGVVTTDYPVSLTELGARRVVDDAIEPNPAPPLDAFLDRLASTSARGLLAELRPVYPAPDDYRLTAWVERQGKAERAILSILLREYPRPVDRQALADETGYHPRSSGFVNALGRVRSLGLVEDFGIAPAFAALMGR